MWDIDREQAKSLGFTDQEIDAYLGEINQQEQSPTFQTPENPSPDNSPSYLTKPTTELTVGEANDLLQKTTFKDLPNELPAESQPSASLNAPDITTKPSALPSDEFVDGTPNEYKAIISDVAKKYGVSTMLLSSQIKQESGFNPTARSPYAAGISQFIPETARSYGLKVDDTVDERLIPEKAIDAQGRMMSDLLKSHGSEERALSAYNSGNPDAYLNPDFSGGETYNYVKSIKAMNKANAPILEPTPEEMENTIGRYNR